MFWQWVPRRRTSNSKRPITICGGTVSWRLAAEWRCCHDAVSKTGDQCTARYCGAVPSWHRRTIIHSLYLMHSGTSSQWRSACSSCVRPWSNFLMPLTTRAAAFNTRCSLPITQYFTYSNNLWAIFLPRQCSDCVKILDLFRTAFIPCTFPWTPVKHSQPDSHNNSILKICLSFICLSAIYTVCFKKRIVQKKSIIDIMFKQTIS